MSVNTNHHRCKESNDFKLTKCYNDFYMKKMNCSFPWINSYNRSLRKCGANDYLKDLVDLVNKNYNPSPKYYKEIEDFGCTIPNCQSTTWSVTSSQDSILYDKDVSKIILNFPSASKVYLIRISVTKRG